MKKKVFGRKLSRSRPAREALFTSLARALIINGKIVTTRAKAKAVVPDVEKLVTLSKKGDLNSRRKALSMLDNSRETNDILFNFVAKAFSERQSGFTRIISLPRRSGDNAQMVRIEWVEKVEIIEKEKTKKEKEVKEETKKKSTKKKVTKAEAKSKKTKSTKSKTK